MLIHAFLKSNEMLSMSGWTFVKIYTHFRETNVFSKKYFCTLEEKVYDPEECVYIIKKTFMFS